MIGLTNLVLKTLNLPNFLAQCRIQLEILTLKHRDPKSQVSNNSIPTLPVAPGVQETLILLKSVQLLLLLAEAHFRDLQLGLEYLGFIVLEGLAPIAVHIPGAVLLVHGIDQLFIVLVDPFYHQVQPTDLQCH